MIWYDSGKWKTILDCFIRIIIFASEDKALQLMVIAKSMESWVDVRVHWGSVYILWETTTLLSVCPESSNFDMALSIAAQNHWREIVILSFYLAEHEFWKRPIINLGGYCFQDFMTDLFSLSYIPHRVIRPIETLQHTARRKHRVLQYYRSCLYFHAVCP